MLLVTLLLPLRSMGQLQSANSDNGGPARSDRFVVNNYHPERVQIFQLARRQILQKACCVAPGRQWGSQRDLSSIIPRVTHSECCLHLWYYYQACDPSAVLQLICRKHTYKWACNTGNLPLTPSATSTSIWWSQAMYVPKHTLQCMYSPAKE